MKKDVMIGFPVYDHRAEISIVQEIYACMHDPNNPVSILQYYNGDSLIPRARNKIAQMFLDSTNDYLMFIDSDIRFRKDHIARLRSFDKPIVGGVYFKKKLPYEPVMNAFIRQEGPLAVMREIGTGFMMIRRDVLESMRDADPENIYRYDRDEWDGEKWGYDWFKTGVKNQRYLSEDYYFCQEAAERGFATYLDQSIITQHIGRKDYPTSDANLMETVVNIVERNTHISNPAMMARLKDAINKRTPDQMDQPAKELLAKIALKVGAVEMEIDTPGNESSNEK